jgi:hypothetical protein
VKLPSNTGWISQENEESIPPSMTIVNGKSSIGFSRTPNKNTNHNTRDPGLLHDSIPDTNRPRLGKFIHSSPPWRGDPNKSTAQEEQRLQVPRVVLERTSQDLNDHVQGCLAELVFNLDEVGISDWEDHKIEKVIALTAMLAQTIHHGVSRNLKYLSVSGRI